jgi:hypothetical protein
MEPSVFTVELTIMRQRLTFQVRNVEISNAAHLSLYLIVYQPGTGRGKMKFKDLPGEMLMFPNYHLLSLARVHSLPWQPTPYH